MTKEKDNLSFGQRFGFEPIEDKFQIESVDRILRTDLLNTFHDFFIDKFESPSKEIVKLFFRIIWTNYFKKAKDDFREDDDLFSFKLDVRWYIEREIWYKVYNFFEFLSDKIQTLNQSDYQQDVNILGWQYDKFETTINKILRSNNSAYTLVGGKFVPITNETEINEIKETQDSAKHYGLKGVQEHLKAAIELISHKPKPDLRNSIKESISMVEAISRVIEPTEDTLGKALTRLEKHQKINKILKAGFEKLYGYTNDKNGIRHALMEDGSVDYEEAKFFLVSCSAFTNYLIEKAKKEGIPLNKNDV